jgi:hypothetical protein
VLKNILLVACVSILSLLALEGLIPCAVGSWGGRRPGLGGDVTGTGATDGVTAAGGR